jgi:SAM-dependent methyltransferase
MKTVLELGCGQGFNAYLQAKKHRVIGVDISHHDLAIAAHRYPGLPLATMSGARLGFKDRVFDAIEARDVLEHVDDLEAVLDEIGRCLKPGGEVTAEVPYWKSERWLTRLRPSYPREIHHVRVFGENELEGLMIRRSFSLSRKKRRGFFSHLEFFFTFRGKRPSRTQLGIGNWRESPGRVILHLGLLYFNPLVLKTPLRYFPVWLITLPLGITIDYLGNRVFPKSLYYRFRFPGPPAGGGGGAKSER